MTNYLVTGGAGFIGSHLVEALLTRPHTTQVRVLDDLSSGYKHNLSAVMERIDFIRGDVRDRDLLIKVVQGIDVIFHLAAQVSVPRSIVDPLTTHDINATGTLNLLQTAKEAGVRRFVFSSTCAVYGDEPTLPKVETMRPCPKSPYAVSKLAAEGYCQNYVEHYGLQIAILRYFNVYGPRQDPSSPYSGVISIFVDRLSGGEGVTIFGDGEQTRDFVFVSDVVEANLLAAERAEAVGQVFNIGPGQPTTINHLYQTICRVMNKHRVPKHAESRSGDIKHSFADASLARQRLDWWPKTSLLDGLKTTINHLG
jgi:UDP-glucose 4-epimerase